MARVAWVFYDPFEDESYSWEVNPNDADSPSYMKNVFYSSSAAPDGKIIMMEGKDEPSRVSFSGVTLTEAQYDEMIRWFNKRNQLELTDDLGRTMSIYITSFAPKRVRSTNYPWRHTYSVEAVVLDAEV